MKPNFYLAKHIRYLVTVLCLLLNGFSHQAKAQWVLVPDSNFRAYINKQFQINSTNACWNGNYIDSTNQLMRTAGIFSIRSQDTIYDLTGIIAFSNLERLEAIGPNLIQFLPVLPNKISQIRLRENKIMYITNFPDSLYWIDCSYNLLSSIPAIPSSLHYAYFTNNLLVTLPSNLQNINTFYVAFNHLTSLPNLPSSLEIFNCTGNNLTILPVLPQNLKYLSCRINQLSALPILPLSLESLDCGYNPLFSLPGNLPNNLSKLYCIYDQLSSLPTLPNSIRTLTCDSNFLSSLPPLPISLKYFSCQYNQLSSIPALPLNLLSIECNNNQLNSLPELPDSLSELKCSNNTNLMCFPRIKNWNNKYGTIEFLNTGINCIPNYIFVYNSNPKYDSLPLCDYLNSNNCTPYWNVAGKTYLDSTADCIFDLSEHIQSNVHLMFYSNGVLQQQSFSENNGFYSFDIDSDGTYVTKLDTVDFPFSSLCPTNDQFSNVLTSTTFVPNNDFSLICKNGVDIGAWGIYAFGLIPGNQSLINFKIGDYSQKFGAHCSNGTGGQVSIIIDGDAKYLFPDSGALTPQVIGDTLIYSVLDFGTIDYNIAFNFIIETDTTAIIDSLVCFHVIVALDSLDNNPSNNTFTECFEVKSSFDPNEKTVSPEGSLDINGDRWLTFTVGFQNTGTAPAEHIYITDTLDANLDLSTFQLLAYSHSPYVQILNGGIAKFNFKNINLPDSVSNEPASHGYVQYKIKAKSNLTNNVQISNTAYIYFDFNVPVVTNTVTNTILNCQQSAGVITQSHDTLNSTIAGATYQWINCTTGNIILNAMAQNFVPTTSGSYAVIVSSGTCTDTSSCHYISLTGISKNFTSDISVSPNPSNDAFVVNCPQNIIGNNLSLKVFDAYGKLIEQKQIISGNTILNATNWSKGIYFLELNIFGNTTVKKLVKE